MDNLGLPIAFGKQQASESTASKPAARGGSSGRGERGVVGGGKRKRGRAVETESRPESVVTEWSRGDLASQYDAFNGGVKKRSLNSHQPRQESHETRGRGRGRGRGAPRGAPRGRGGFGGSRKPDTFHGRYLKESMWEDPWEEIILARQAGTA